VCNEIGNAITVYKVEKRIPINGNNITGNNITGNNIYGIPIKENTSTRNNIFRNTICCSNIVGIARPGIAIFNVFRPRYYSTKCCCCCLCWGGAYFAALEVPPFVGLGENCGTHCVGVGVEITKFRPDVNQPIHF